MPSPTPPRVAIKTLGCKLNQFESQQVLQRLVRMGCMAVPFEGPADIYIINSCTVTARTDRDCRRLIRHARKLNPDAFIAVTGCYAEVNPKELRAIPEADLIVGNADKSHLADLIRQRLPHLLAGAGDSLPADHATYAGGELLEGFCEHTRAFVKVQEGCDAHCTYCIVPRARGPSRSVPVADVVGQVKRLVAAGFAELVLIGTHLGKYGEDLTGAPDLAGLVDMLTRLPGLGRLRLSSIEPREITPRLIALVAEHPRVCRHLHIPLQSGCDSVLRRMGRPYDGALYAELLHTIHAADAGICLGADVMVGFPGETEEEFETTFRFVEKLPLACLHVFTYSPRPGTPAADMPGQVNHEVKIARNHRLRELSELKREDFGRQMIGRTLQVIFEQPLAEEPGVLEGLSDNYLRVHVPAPDTLRGALCPVLVEGAEGGALRGRLS